MSSEEIFIKRTTMEDGTIVENPVEQKVKKVKKEMTNEKKALLLERLRAGKLKAKLARDAKKQSNLKQEKQIIHVAESVSNPGKINIETKEKVAEIKTTWSIHDDINELKYQLRELRSSLNKTKKEEKVESKIEKIIEKKETAIEKKETVIEHNPKPAPSNPINIPQPPKKVKKSLFAFANF